MLINRIPIACNFTIGFSSIDITNFISFRSENLFKTQADLDTFVFKT